MTGPPVQVDAYAVKNSPTATATAAGDAGTGSPDTAADDLERTRGVGESGQRRDARSGDDQSAIGLGIDQ